jgi:hypothetical protein
MLFECLLMLAAAIAIGGAIIAFDGNRDVFHPLIFIGPMMAFLYGWMPWQLYRMGGLAQFFDESQLIRVQTFFVICELAFVLGCLSVGIKVSRRRLSSHQTSPAVVKRLLLGGVISGSIGVLCWAITIINVGGFVNAYSSSYAGGWDDSGYVRDGSLLLLTGILLCIPALSAGVLRKWSLGAIGAFSLPWLSQALLMARRGPTFAFVLIILMGWYFNRKKRPPILAFATVGVGLGWLVLFLVTNRSAIYLGSNFDVSTQVQDVVVKPDNGNEYIYGAGTVIAAERRDHYFWMRRYLAQILVRPIPSAIWPTKYEDFGVPELLNNAGTAEGFADALGWAGAPGSAPGIAADLWVELWWLAVPATALLGYTYGKVWRNAVDKGGAWTSQYIILSSLSIYLVMQTMEAVIFRTILLSVPCWLTWRYALKALPAGNSMRAARSRFTHLPAIRRRSARDRFSQRRLSDV